MKSRLLLISLLMFIMFNCNSVHAESRALIMGVGKYQQNQFNLAGIALDVSMIKSVALKMGFKDGQIHTLENSQLTRENIEHEFNHWLKEAGEEDRVLVYYSGHGYQVKDKNDDESDGYDEVLTLYDLDIDGDVKGVLLDDDLQKLLSNLPSRHKIMIVDACCSGTSSKGLSLQRSSFPNLDQVFIKSAGCPSSDQAEGKNDYPQLESESIPGLVYLSAAQDYQKALASREGSFFTIAIKEAFDTHGRNQSPEELKAFAKSFIYQHVDESRIYWPNLTGDTALFQSKDIFVLPQQASGNSNQQQMQVISDNTSGNVFIDSPRKAYRMGESISFDLDMPTAGYLNIVTVDANDKYRVLFPNAIKRDNHFPKGFITMPEAGFEFIADEPRGTMDIIALITTDPVNLFDESYDRNTEGESTSTFLTPSPRSISDFERGVYQGYNSGSLSITIQ